MNDGPNGQREDVTVSTRWGLGIPMRDGVELNAIHYAPASGERAPAIVTLTPYIAQTFHDRGLYFAGEGFHFLIVDSRGRGNSGGAFEPHINEGRDGHDIIEWAAAQPFCDGKVAMWGGSYGGYNQWMTAAERPPHLQTIVPVASPNFGIDFPLRNKIPSPYVMQWLTLVWGRASQADVFYDQSYWNARFTEWCRTGRRFREFDDFLGSPSPSFRRWIGNVCNPAFWAAYNPSAEAYRHHDLPTLTITGIYDGDQPGALRHYREHLGVRQNGGRPDHFLVIGPWDHAGTRTPRKSFNGVEVGEASLVDMNALHRDWYRFAMLGGDRPAFLADQVVYFVMEADIWRSSPSLEAITVSERALFLTSSGRAHHIWSSGELVAAAPATASVDQYVYDPRDRGLVDLERHLDPESLVDERMFWARDGKQLVYHTGVIDQEFELSGFIRLELWLAIDRPDTDFRVSLYDIDEKGRGTLLSSDTKRARFRSGEGEELIRTSGPLPYRFDQFVFVSRLIRCGHQLRLVIAPMNSIHDQWNMNGGGDVFDESIEDAEPVTVRLHHGPACPSVLYVPVGSPRDLEAADESAVDPSQR